jgi:hypothetical protein
VGGGIHYVIFISYLRDQGANTGGNIDRFLPFGRKLENKVFDLYFRAAIQNSL